MGTKNFDDVLVASKGFFLLAPKGTALVLPSTTSIPAAYEDAGLLGEGGFNFNANSENNTIEFMFGEEMPIDSGENWTITTPNAQLDKTTLSILFNTQPDENGVYYPQQGKVERAGYLEFRRGNTVTHVSMGQMSLQDKGSFDIVSDDKTALQLVWDLQRMADHNDAPFAWWKTVDGVVVDASPVAKSSS